MERSLEHEQLIPILQAALDRPTEKREDFVRAACSGDEELHQELREALQWEERMGSFLLEPIVDLAHLARPFQSGQVVVERFEILREIGEGGMGVVYEAFDRKLQQRIAIKAAKPGFQRLLSPELRAALKVSHHNICRENEIYTVQTDVGEIDFLTMELLEGGTLSAYLAEKGKLGHEEASEIAYQLCVGLAEAHRRGILHRDLKSSNVILSHDENGNRRAVITDFGLAGGLSLASGETGGTPGYMAPELWRGQPASKASDIYALGVILYEMVAGCKPYDQRRQVVGPTATTRTLQEQTQTREAAVPLPAALVGAAEQQWRQQEVTVCPPRPSAWTKNLNPCWDRAIKGCLEVSPAERTQDVSQVLAELQWKPIPKWPFVVTGLLLAVLVAAVALSRPLRLWVTELIWPPNVRLAVLPFDGPKDLAAIGGGALQEVAERVQQLPSERKWPLNKLSRSVAVIPPSRIANAHAETPQKARDALHATHALKVSLQPEGDRLSAHAAVIELSSQLPVKELSVQYQKKDAGAMSAALTHFVALSFRLQESSSDDKVSPAAAGSYLQGIYFLNRDAHSFDSAIVQFQEAARLDPNSALPPAGMALALVQKSSDTKQNIYLEQAREFVRTAQSRNPDSVRVLLASGRVNEATSQYNRALADYRRIQELEPRNVDALLRMGVVYQHLEEPDDALKAFRKAEELDPEYYRPYQMMGDFYYFRGRYVECAEEYRKMIERAPGMFDAYTALASPLVELGRYSEAEEVLQKSLKIRETAYALNGLGAIRCREGRFDEAIAYQKRALAYDPHNFNWLLNLGDNTRWAGHPAEARPYYSKGRDEAKAQMTLNPQSARARAYFAHFSARLGDKVRAKDEIKQAMNLAPGDNEVLLFVILTYEMLGERDMALDALRGVTLAQMKQFSHHPDLAGFCQDPRFKQQMSDKGG